MEANIVSVRENPLMDRREVDVSLYHEGEATPSEENVKSRVAAENGIETESIEVESIYTGFGSQKSKATLKVLEDFDYDEELEEEAMEEEVEVTEDYREAVSGTITEAKDTLQDMEDVDWNAAIEAEERNKNRKTLIEWLEGQIEG